MNSIKRIINISFLLADYVVAFFIVVMTASAWCYDANIELQYLEFNGLFLKILLLYALLGVLFGRYHQVKQVNVKRMCFAASCIGIFAYLNAFNKNEFIQKFILMFAGILLWMIFREKKEEVWKIIINIVVSIAIVSLFFYVFGSCLKLIPAYYSVPRMWGEWAPKDIKNYYYLYYESQQLEFSNGLIIWRNCGLFAESPMFNFVLCIALAAETFLVKEKSKWKTTILIITVLTTFATTGLLFLVLLLLLYILNNSEGNKVLKRIRPYLKYLVAAIIIIGVLIVMLKGITSGGRGSASVRVDHTKASLRAFLDCFVYGCGWSNHEYVWQYAHFKQGLSVGLPYFMACGGLLLSSILLIPVIHDGIYAYRNQKWDMFFFEILFVMLFFFTIVMGYPIFLVGLGYILLYGSIATDSGIEYGVGLE